MPTLSSPSYRPLGHMPLYHQGAMGYWHGREVTVSHIMITRKGLFVYLMNHEHPVPSEQVEMPLTRLEWPKERLAAIAIDDTPASQPTSAVTEPSADDIFEQALA